MTPARAGSGDAAAPAGRPDVPASGGAALDADVAVLGGGPAGLAAAWRAALAGHRVVVLERGPAPGGMAAGVEVAGVRADLGSHRLHPSVDPGILAALRALPGLDLQWRRRHGRIRLAGRWLAFPLRPADLARRLPPAFLLGAAVDAALAPARRPRADTFAEVVRAGLGPTMGERFYFPYARKLWGLDPDELSGEHARRRISAGTPGGLARRVLRGARQGGGAGFWYPARGFGAIPEALAAAAEEAGARLRFGAEVTGIGPGDGGGRRWRVSTAGRGVVTAAHVWSTLPLAALVGLVRPSAPPPVVAAAGRVRARALVLVYLVVPQPRWTPFDAHYFPLGDTPLSRVSEPRNYRDGPDPADRSVLCAELPCDVGDATWAAPDHALADLVARSLAAQGLPPVAPVEVAVRRLPAAYPVLRPGDEAAVAVVDAWAAGTGVVSFGRHGLVAHDNTHHALAEGWAVAACLRPDGTFDDDDAWARARARFAAHVVED